jgi:hypothetical protein
MLGGVLLIQNNFTYVAVCYELLSVQTLIPFDKVVLSMMKTKLIIFKRKLIGLSKNTTSQQATYGKGG